MFLYATHLKKKTSKLKFNGQCRFKLFSILTGTPPVVVYYHRIKTILVIDFFIAIVKINSIPVLLIIDSNKKKTENIANRSESVV